MKKGRLYARLKEPRTKNQEPRTKNQEPRTKNQEPRTKRKLGFTLSELLVSLAVLGLIAGLTVPSIVVAVNKSKKKAVQKEVVNMVANIAFDFANAGDNPNQLSFPAYFLKKANVTKSCPNNSFSQGCVTKSMQPYQQNNPGALLLNGATMVFQLVPGTSQIYEIVIDYDGEAGSNDHQANLWYVISVGDTPTNYSIPASGNPISVPLKPYQVVPSTIRFWVSNNLSLYYD